MRNFLITAVSALLLMGCGQKKELAPAWTTSKPIDASGTYVYGVGMSYVNPNSAYQQAARSNALADLAQEVESQIYDETRILQKEDASGFGTSFSSQTLTRSHVKLEEYTQVDSFADELRYYTLYRLDLPKFLEVKAAADQRAQAWIAERTVMASSKEHELSYRWNLLGDAVDKAISRNFLTDPTFSVQTKSLLIKALRDIEQDMTGEFRIPETVRYLGMPDQFSAAYQSSSPAIAPHLELRSSAGEFAFNSENSAVYCTATGKENAVQLTMHLNLDTQLPSLSSVGRNWLKEQMNWSKGTTLYFQNTAVNVTAPKKLRSEISRSIAKLFITTQDAPLTLNFIGELSTISLAKNRFKASVDGRFVLAYSDTEQIVWTSQRIQDSAISVSKEAAQNSALNTFSENIDLFILPQLERSLGY